ncbi:hypothetical protein AKJ39_04350 [candidate division MSBL1 archaeon SCGC-AAA259J03]|uniref:PIN domain-containing protein n=2 Tax=candidate division MSBL1 TaxID=215777 RepID=A0A133UQ59_9EURY|nr:hypothetical protein AKJ38_03575 [candidate division MSBL1 archaeon SCGC-AAA259I14]KXA96634.1 hypothetical protein AKJ39_04350 [candidate division MSBL1 archaeon SCGC-AAA259J03]
MRKILLDTYAWIEYLEGSEEGEEVKDFLENDDKAEIYTSIMTVAELSDAFHRGDVDTELKWEDILDFVQLNSSIVKPDVKNMASAGSLKVRRREEFEDFGLIDAIILESSKMAEAELMTGDPHLEGETNAISLGR